MPNRKQAGEERKPLVEYQHELSNYRIALARFNARWAKARDGGAALWKKVLGNALRLAERIDKQHK